MLIVCLVMTFQGLSQTTYQELKENRVKVVVFNKDTLIQFKLSDAKIVLADVLEKERLDSLVEYMEQVDSLKDATVSMQFNVIKDLKTKCDNLQKIIDNMTIISVNKDAEIAILNETIKKQKKEIRKQKFLKVVGFTAAVVLPIITIITLH